MTGTTVTAEKYHGTENDFLVLPADAPVPDRAAFAKTHCDRETGVGGERTGADGVLFLDLDPSASPVRVTMTLVQPDGSIAEMCGNGARVTAVWAARATGASEVVIETPAGDRHAVVQSEGVTVEMGRPSFDPADVPLAHDADGPLIETDVEGLTVTAVNTGVPHAVAFVDDVDAVDLETVAPPVRHADVFPEGANVTLASRASLGDAREGAPGAPAAFRQRTFERGVEGETLACGTGAVAVVAAAKRTGRLDTEGPVRVSPPGGDLVIVVPDDGPATLTGPVEREFEVDLEVPAS
ncbi:diaminopimelate epimerase [Haloplanus aerogenes]|uniref:Diaminopimelate epimerase n=1 Tax=Haloplanus aerogenes TaxID=660522 RepID=A0A3G8QV11_9EURY|nr:diaminopimelate epimerase [Haloplanus aerogenes]AZH25588.1 diaminopimelate epimerase [Haloplanus aerogenes]RMB25309.1 diaminopimelate epimerase [Haloplanus aerogenes]